MTNVHTVRRGPIPAGAPRFRGVWNGRHELTFPTVGSGHPTTMAIGVVIRRGTAAPALPGRAAIGVLGAPRRSRRAVNAG